MSIIVAIVGMTGSGKSTVADYLVDHGFTFLRFGQITLDIVMERGLEPTEENERPIREEVRKTHGMAAYAILNLPKIEKLSASGDVVIDGLYSWEEYVVLKERFGDQLIVLAIFCSPKTRYHRLAKREYDPKKDPNMRSRPATKNQSASRDKSEIENLNKAGPIVMADYTILNEGTFEKLKADTKTFYGWMRRKQ